MSIKIITSRRPSVSHAFTVPVVRETAPQPPSARS